MIKPIGVTGFARSGKDTFFELFNRYCLKNNIKTKRIALADNLKKDLKDFVSQNFSVDILNINGKDKEFVRPLMVVYGKLKREFTEGKYWTNKIQYEIDECISTQTIPVITDIRYSEYQEDELFWLKKKNNGLLVSITLKSNKPANKEEKENIFKIKQQADFKINWKPEPNKDILYKKYENKFKEISANARVP
jgi:hypothetical protein